MKYDKPKISIDLQEYLDLKEIEKKDRKKEETVIVSIFEKSLSDSSLLRDFTPNNFITVLQRRAKEEGYVFGIIENQGEIQKKIIFKKIEE